MHKKSGADDDEKFNYCFGFIVIIVFAIISAIYSHRADGFQGIDTVLSFLISIVTYSFFLFFVVGMIVAVIYSITNVFPISLFFVVMTFLVGSISLLSDTTLEKYTYVTKEEYNDLKESYDRLSENYAEYRATHIEEREYHDIKQNVEQEFEQRIEDIKVEKEGYETDAHYMYEFLTYNGYDTSELELLQDYDYCGIFESDNEKGQN